MLDLSINQFSNLLETLAVMRKSSRHGNINDCLTISLAFMKMLQVSLSATCGAVLGID